MRSCLVLSTAAALTLSVLGAAPVGAGAVPADQRASSPVARAGSTTLGQLGSVACNTGGPAAVVIGSEGAGGASTYIAPSNGVITSFSHLANGTSGQVRAIVFADGATASQKTVTAKSSKQTVVRNQLNTFATQLPIKAGQRVGLGYTVGNMACAGAGVPGDSTWVRTSFDPDTTSAFVAQGVLSLNASSAYRPNISAVLEPDVDGDGYGDVSQDACPASALSQVACPAPETTVTKRPKRFRANPKVKVKFTSSIPGSTFECSLDGRKYKKCKSPYKKTWGRGLHSLKIRAVSPVGIVDPKPAKVKVEITKG